MENTTIDTLRIGLRTFELVRADPKPLRVTLHHGDKVRFEDAALVLGVSRHAIYAYIASGVLTKWKLAGRAYITWDQLETLLTKGCPSGVRSRKRVA